MKRAVFAATVGVLSMLVLAGPADAFSTAAATPIRKIPVNARNYRDGVPGTWASGAVYTRCGAIGVEAVFTNNARPLVNTGRQTYSISIEIDHNGIWDPVKGSEVESYRPSAAHQRYEFDRYVNPGWHYKYRVLVANHTGAPLLGTMWVNAAANDNNPADHDVADCQ
jgi:hypothetical protein